jgi:hypothetical protein
MIDLAMDPVALATPTPPQPENQIDLMPPVAEGIDLDEPIAKAPVPEKTADLRAAKADYGWVQGKSPGKDLIRSSMTDGNEQTMRERATSDANAEYRDNKIELVKATTGFIDGIDPKETNTFLEGMLKAQPKYNPETVFEQKYASAYINTVMTKGEGETLMTRAMDKSFNLTLDVSHIAEGTVARGEAFRTIAEDMDAQASKQSWGGWGVDFTKTLVPGYSWAKMHDLTAVTDSYLPGSNLQAQVQNLWLMPADEAQKTLKEAVARLAVDNPQEAQRLAHAAVAYGTSEALLTNLFGVADALTVGEVAGAVVKGAAKLGAKAVAKTAAKEVPEATTQAEVKTAFKDSVSGLEGNPSPDQVLSANGHVAQAADYKTLKIMRAGDPTGDSVEITSRVPSLFNPEVVIRNPGSLSREQTERLTNQMQDRATRLIKTLDDPSKVNRAPQAAYEVGIKEARDELSRRYPHLNDAILDVQTRDGELVPFKYNRPEDNNANVGSVSIHLGTPDAGLFSSGQEAAMWAEKMYKLDLTDPGLKIQQQGSGFYLSVTKNINETTDAFRNALITTKNTTPQSLANTWLGKLRSPEDTLSELNRNNRHSLTHAGELIKSQFIEAAKDVSKNLSKKQIDRMERVFEANRAFQDPVTGQVGRFHQTTGDFENAYFKIHGTRPTEAEHSAYFTYVQLNDMDWVVRNLGWYRDKARIGIENMSFTHMATNEAGAAALTKVPAFEGKYLTELPWKQADDAGIYVIDGEGKGTVYRKNAASAETKASIEQKIAEGYRIVQVYNPTKGIGAAENVHFVVAKDTQASKLGWQQAPYRPGGHVEYADAWFTKQTKVTRKVGEDGRVSHVSEGDVAAFSHTTEAEAKEFSQAMETGRSLLNRGLDRELKEHLEQSLPYSLQKFKNLFEDVHVNGKITPAVYSKTEPFMHTSSGQSTADRAFLDGKPLSARYENFEDLNASPYNLSASVDKKFAGTRDAVLPTIEKRGSETNPVFQMKPSTLIDPMTTLNRSMANVMRSRLMTDYKISSVESWIQEFGHLLGKTKDELRADPMAIFNLDPVFVSGASASEMAAARNSRMNIRNLLGQESAVGEAVRNAQSYVMDTIYKTTGQAGIRAVQTGIEHTPAWMISTLTDPAKALRSMAFLATQGMFNPVQLLLQAQTLTHVLGVAGPVNGMKAMNAGVLMKYAGMNSTEAVLNRLGGIAETMGTMSKKDFIESFKHFQKSGLQKVEGEVANLDDVLDPKMFQSGVNQFLNKGTMFFRGGEEAVRHAAWNAAYIEWRGANKGAELTNQVRNEILTRANLFGANMTRASSAAWQQGVWSVPSQFFGYPVRLAEQFLGKRLTWQEKGQALATYSAMYGVPSGLATATAIPFYDDMRTYALDHGIDVHNNFFSAVMEGLPSTLVKAWTGSETNFASRYGSNGVSMIHDIAHGNMSLAKFVMGASGSIVGDMMTAGSPLLAQLTNPFKDGNDQLPLTMDDFQAAASGISSINNVMKTAIGYASQKYMSKNGVFVSDLSATESAQVFFGLTPRRITDANLMSMSMKEQRDSQKGWETLIVQQYNRALEEGAKGNTELMNDYLKRAKIFFKAGDFQAMQAGEMLTKSLKGWEAKIDQVEANFNKNAPESQKKARQEATFPELKN